MDVSETIETSQSAHNNHDDDSNDSSVTFNKKDRTKKYSNRKLDNIIESVNKPVLNDDDLFDDSSEPRSMHQPAINDDNEPKSLVPTNRQEKLVNKDVPVQKRIFKSKYSNNEFNNVIDLVSKPDVQSSVQSKINLQNKVEASIDKHNLSAVINLDVPLINIPNVTCTTEFEIAVLGHLSMIYTEQQQQRQILLNLEKYLSDKEIISNATNAVDFLAKYNYEIPIEDNPTFIKFNEELSVNKYMKNDVISILKTCVDKDNVITKSILTMLRRFISKTVCLQYTAIRKSPKDDKNIFKTCEFCQVMEYIITKSRDEKNLETTEKLLTKGLSDVLCNAMHWDSKREKK